MVCFACFVFIFCVSTRDFVCVCLILQHNHIFYYLKNVLCLLISFLRVLLRYNGHEALYKVQGMQHNDLTYIPYEMITTVSLVNLYHKIENKRKIFFFLVKLLGFTLTTSIYNIEH